jgi:hypothetical protein
VTPDAATERVVLSDVGRAFATLVEELRIRASAGDGAGGPQLSQFAEQSFSRFVERLLGTLLSATAAGADADADAWVRRHYQDWLDKAGAGMRDALAGSRARHKVAQALQGKMFDADAALRRALGLRQRVQACADLA